MPLELLQYAVYADSVPQTDGNLVEIAVPGAVPVGETWRVDRISAVISTLNQSFTGGAQGSGPPVLFVYDTLSPGPTTAPLDVTQLSAYPTALVATDAPLGGIFMYYLDVADYSAPLTLLAGSSLLLLAALGFLNTGPWIFSARVQYTRFKGVAGRPQPVAGVGPAPSIPASI